MKKIMLLSLLFLGQLGFSQVLYDPQTLYDSPGGLFDTDSLRSMYIEFYDTDYDSILQANWYSNTGLRLSASLQMSNGISFDTVAVRYKGNSTFSVAADIASPKLPLNIDINDLISGQKLMGYKKIKLSNAIFDPTFCKELAAYNIYRRYLPSSQANFMKVYVQGNYLGLYVNTQAVDKVFLKKHFGENDGVLFKCDPIQQFGQPGPQGSADLVWLGADTTLYDHHYKLKSDEGWQELVDLMYTLEFEPEKIDSILNVDRVLWAFAVNNVLLNLDTYNGLYKHNYYLYRTKDGLFQMIPWDLTEAFLGSLISHNPDFQALFGFDPFNGYSSFWTPLVKTLTSDTESLTAKIYAAHIRTVLEESLDVAEIGDYVAYLQDIAYDAVEADDNNVFSMADFYYNVDEVFYIPGVFATAGITSTASIRKTFLENHAEINKTSPEIINVDLMESSSNLFVTTIVSNATSVELMTTVSPHNSKFQSNTMYDDGTNGDAVAGDDIYTAILPFQNSGQEVKYYIRSQNSEAIKLSPERAEYEFYIYSPFTAVAEKEVIDFLDISPNPFDNTITIRYSLRESASVKVSIYNAIGQEVEVLVDGAQQSGEHLVEWSPGNLSNGIYFYSFKVDEGLRTGKLVFNKK